MAENTLSPALAHGAGQRKVTWQRAAPYVFISPFYILFAIFDAFPIVFSLWISFMNWKGVRSGVFIGLENYARLFRDPNFHIALKNTLFVGLIYIPLILLFSLGLAAILNRPMPLRTLYRTGYFLPVITSLVVVGLLFRFFFESPYSPLAFIYTLLGLEFHGLTATAAFVKPVLLAMLLWRWLGFNMVLMLAGLQGIPGEVYDAAMIDGAGNFQSFVFLTIPLMRRVIAFVAILSTISLFNIFDEAYVLGGSLGGTMQAGLLTGVFIYREGFLNFKFGYAAAAAYVLALVIVVLSLLQVHASEHNSA